MSRYTWKERGLIGVGILLIAIIVVPVWVLVGLAVLGVAKTFLSGLGLVVGLIFLVAYLAYRAGFLDGRRD